MIDSEEDESVVMLDVITVEGTDGEHLAVISVHPAYADNRSLLLQAAEALVELAEEVGAEELN